MEKRWIKAATILQPSIEVCGKRLFPFCLRHRVALEAIDSPVLDPKKPMTAKHLVAAVKILSSKTIEEISTKATLREKFWVSRMQFGDNILIEETAKLMAYLDLQALWPRFWEKEGGVNKAGIPWQLVVIASLTRNGCTLDQAWTMPEAEAIWMHTAHSACLGADIAVISDEDWEAIQKHKEQSKQNKTRN